MALVASLAACATPPPETDANARQAYIEANDPLEPMNRGIFEFNRVADRFVLKPVAIAYRDVVPPFVQDMTRNFLDNLRQPLNFANALLQGDVDRAGSAFGRFAGNTLIGLGGMFDVMTNVPKVEEDFGQTLAVWGVPAGPYLMLPLLGPSNPRDTTGLVVEAFADPFNWYANRNDQFWFPITRAAVSAVDYRSRNIATLDEIEANSLDFYATIRSLSRQRRGDEIRNGKPAPEPTRRSDDDMSGPQPMAQAKTD
jgi:phospholipid-binding lipoprotein MlaA